MPSLQSLWQQMDIMLTINGIHILANVIIVDLRLMKILFHKSFLLKEWLGWLQLRQNLCYIMTNTLKMIHPSNMRSI